MRASTRSRLLTSRICIFALLIVLCSLAVSCSQETGPESATYTSSNIGSDGGSLELTASDGTACRLTIPADLLSATTEIKITAVSSSTGNSLGALSNDFMLEPEGLEFDTPVTIAITVPNQLPSDRAPAILHTAADGPGVLLETQVDGQTLSASLTHFSWISPVAPNAEELESYWYLVVQQEIDIYGVNVDRVRTLASIYLHAQADSEVYGSIDLSAWRAELWAYTNDLIIMGSLRCTDNEYEEAEYILGAARNIADLCLFTDLVAEAEQALEDCREQPGGSFPVIYWRISEVQNVGEIYIRGLLDEHAMARATWGEDTGWKGYLRERAPDGSPWVQAENTLVLTFRFVVHPGKYTPYDESSAYFEVKVDGEIVIAKQLSAARGQTYEETETLTFPGVLPPVTSSN